MITYATLYTAKLNGTLPALLAGYAPAERIEAAEVCAANTRLTVSEWLNIFGKLIDAELARIEEDAADRDQAIALAEVAADRAEYRYQVIVALLDAGHEKAAGYVEHGATWERTADGLVVQRAGGERHTVKHGTCVCSAAQRGRKCWAVAVSEVVAAEVAA